MKKLCIIAGLLITSFFLINIVVKDTYSKYSSSGKVGISGNTGNWMVKINGQDITNSEGISETFNIQNLNYPESTYVSAGKIAPGVTGNFQIEIKAEDTEVAIKFDVILDPTNVEETGRIHLTNVKKIVNGEEESNGIIKTDENTYTGVISLSNIENEDSVIVQVEFEWPNDTTGANDIADSELGTDTTKTPISIPVIVNATQYMGETITQYTGA